MDLSSSTPVTVSGVTTTLGGGSRGPTAADSLAWSPNGDKIAAIADWEVDAGDLDNQFSAFVLPSSAPAGGVRILGGLAEPAMDARQVLFSSDSQRLFMRGDLRYSGMDELFSTSDLTTADQSPATTLLEAVPTGGWVDGMVLPY